MPKHIVNQIGHGLPSLPPIEPNKVYMGSEINKRIDLYNQHFEAAQEKYRSLIEPLKNAVDRWGVSRTVLFASLMFVSAPDWKGGLKTLQDQFNSAVTSLQHAIERTRRQANEWTQPPALLWLCDTLEADLLDSSAKINEAVTAAIGGNDGGLKLRQLKDFAPDIALSIDERLAAYGTDAYLRNTKIDRANVFIAINCIRYEGEGLTSIREQWKAVYDDLKSKHDHLAGDAAAAWEHFKSKNPHGMNLTELRQYEQDISRMKKIVRGKMPPPESSDKVPTPKG